MTEHNDISNRRVLVIDDNPAIHDDFRKILIESELQDKGMAKAEEALFGIPSRGHRGFKFQCDFAAQGKQGLELLDQAKAQGRPYEMAFVDVRMPPGWDGVETVTHLWQVCPDLQVVLCTAYSDYSLDDIQKALGRSDRLLILKKPFDKIEVLQLANTLTEKWRLQRLARMQTAQLEQHIRVRTTELLSTREKLDSEIAERAQVEEAFRQAQKMESIGQLASGVAHDFNNLITVIRGYAACIMAEARLEPRMLEAMQQVDGAAQRAANLTRQLLTFSRKQISHAEPLDLNEVIAQVSKLLHRILGEDIASTLQLGDSMPGVSADRAMLEQIILNLAVNARDAMPRGGRLILSTHIQDLSPEHLSQHPSGRTGQFVCVTVTDSGCGIAPEILPRIFEPFFTTKGIGQGTGLGLATVYGIVKQHHGWIEVQSTPGQGATFRIYLPRLNRAVEVSKDNDPQTVTRGGKETMLLVEDESAVRILTSKLLERYGYNVFSAGSGAEAIRVWQEHSEEIDLLLTDMVMPDGMSGPDLAQRLCATKSDLKVILSSGYTREQITDTDSLQAAHSFLPKPYSPDQLAHVVRRCLDGQTDTRSSQMTFQAHEHTC